MMNESQSQPKHTTRKEQMRPVPSLAMSAAALLALTTATRTNAFKANASGVLGRSLSHLVSGGGKTGDATTKPVLDTSRTGVKRGLFSSLFGGKSSEGIDYSTLKGQ